MQNSISNPPQILKFCIATFLCFASVYLSEKTLGAVATIPFILILPGIAYLIYGKMLHITGLCALAAFIFKCIFSSSVFEIMLFVIFCSILSTVSAFAFSKIKLLASKNKDSKMIIPAILFFVFAVMVYIFFYGTFWGNLSSKKANLEYIDKTYPKEEFLTGSTYYSFSDRCYVTEIGFTAKERYSALISASTGSDTEKGFAKIDGYRDLIKYEILNIGRNEMRAALTSHSYEGSDYVIRNSSVDTKDVLTSTAAYRDYLDCANYEIALYYSFATKESFEKMCREYAGHLSKYPNVLYKKITFYGFDTSDSEDFAYSLDYVYGSDKFESKDFDSSKYSRYFNEKDTHKYWDLLG